MTIAVKICGLNSRVAVEAAITGGADYLGFVFYPPSPRAVSPEAAAKLAALASPEVRTVAVFVDPDDDDIRQVLAACPFAVIQLHGQETPERVRDIARRFTSCRVMKAVPVAGPDEVVAAKAYEAVSDMLLFDAKPPKSMAGALPGGNGLRFDWELLRRDWRSEKPWMLSGGLDETVIADAVAVSGAALVDISSGVEVRPGEKSPEKIRSFLAAAKAI